jgi:hypothetical protein
MIDFTNYIVMDSEYKLDPAEFDILLEAAPVVNVISQPEEILR